MSHNSLSYWNIEIKQWFPTFFTQKIECSKFIKQNLSWEAPHYHFTTWLTHHKIFVFLSFYKFIIGRLISVLCCCFLHQKGFASQNNSTMTQLWAMAYRLGTSDLKHKYLTVQNTMKNSTDIFHSTKTTFNTS